MKSGIAVFLALFLVACERFPVNPPKAMPPGSTVSVQFLSSDYVATEPGTEGLVADKVNILSFAIRAENFQAKALEFYGKVVIEGPPDARQHSIQFRTDDVVVDPPNTGYTFNTLDSVATGYNYVLVRPKYPTNEYSPFEGTQGKIIELTITEVWAYDQDGNRISVTIENGQ